MNAIHTAGYDDPILYGPQVSLENSSWWDLKYVEDLEFLTGFGPYNGESGTAGGTPAYNYLTTGDSKDSRSHSLRYVDRIGHNGCRYLLGQDGPDQRVGVEHSEHCVRRPSGKS